MKLKLSEIMEAAAQARVDAKRERNPDITPLLVAEANALFAKNLKDRFLWSAVFELIAEDPVWKDWEEIDFPGSKILRQAQGTGEIDLL